MLRPEESLNYYLHEALLEVSLAGVAVQIGHVKPVTVQVRRRGARPG